MGDKAVLQLFGPTGTMLPSWFLKYEWGRKIKYKTTDFLPFKNRYGLVADKSGGFPLVLSSPERAIFEVLLLVPRCLSFESAGHLMEGLATLRPRLVNALLKACRSVKVKRSFLFLAEQANHSWFGKLNLSRLRLGRGKRVIVPGGHFDRKYQITVSPRPDTGSA
jgi:hypothetical protein